MKTKEELLNLLETIKNLNTEIDELVMELYEISEEDKEVVRKFGILASNKES